MVTLQISTHLWMIWLRIAFEHEFSADGARENLGSLDRSDPAFSLALEAEMYASLVGVSAAAHAIDALYGEIRVHIPIPDRLAATWEKNRTSRPGRIFETLKTGCTLGSRGGTWPQDLKWLYGLRDAAVHHQVEASEGSPHPSGTTHVGKEMAIYTVEATHTAIDLALDVVVVAVGSPRPEMTALREWADGMSHVPPYLIEERGRRRATAS